MKLTVFLSVTVLFLIATSIVFFIPSASGDQKLQNHVWVKNIKNWWSDGKISDKEFVDAFQYLIDNKVLIIYGLNYDQKNSFTEKLGRISELADHFDIEKSQDKITNINAFDSKPVSNIFIKTKHVYIEPVLEVSKDEESHILGALTFWEERLGIKLSNVADPDSASVVIKWIKEADSQHAGYMIDNKLIEIGTGDSKCDGTWHRYNSEFIGSLLKHELGHALGLDHSNDQTDIMYNIVPNAKYAPIDYSYDLRPTEAIFIHGCTFSEKTAFDYKVTTDDQGHGLSIFFIKSEEQYKNFLKGQKFSYYNNDGCYATNIIDYRGTCYDISKGAGLLIVMPKELDHSTARVSVKIQEKT